MVTSASASGSPLGLKPSPSRSFINASISTGKNGAEAGMVKTRGRWAMADALCHRLLVRAIGNRSEISPDVDKARAWICSGGAGRDRGLGLRDGARRADMHPHALEPQAVQA